MAFVNVSPFLFGRVLLLMLFGSQNFSTSFRWLDYMFGTDDKYRAYKKRLAAVAEKDRAALEKKLLEEAEKEGVVAADEAEKKRLF